MDRGHSRDQDPSDDRDPPKWEEPVMAQAPLITDTHITVTDTPYNGTETPCIRRVSNEEVSEVTQEPHNSGKGQGPTNTENPNDTSPHHDTETPP